MLYLPHAGVLWPGVDARCALSASQLIQRCFLPSWGPSKPSVNHMWSRLPTTPAPLHKNQIRLLPRKCPVTGIPWEQPMCAGWGVRVFFFFFKSRW